MKRHPLLVAACGSLLPLAASALGQGFVFTKIVDNNDPIPGGAGALFAPTDEPALDGDTIVFRNGGPLNPDSIWTIARGGVFTKVVDLNTPVPGGVGNFSALIAQYSSPGIPLLRGGTVVFAGHDSNTTAKFNTGLYSVPVAGGAITRVVDYMAVEPGKASTFPNNSFGLFSFDAGRVAFYGDGNIYAVNADGSGLIPVADGAHPVHPEFVFPVVNFGGPSISAGRVLFEGTTVFDPSNGFNGLYTNPASASYQYNEIANGGVLPGDPTSPAHTRYDGWHLDDNTVAFVADDSNSSFFGLYTMSAGGSAPTTIVDGLGSLPGLANINANSLRQFSLQGGLVAFRAQDDGNNIGLFAANADGSGLGKVLVTGDPGPFADLGGTVGGLTGNTLSLGTNGVSHGSIVFHDGGGIYLATAANLAADLQTTLTHTPELAPLGTSLTYTLTVTNAGPAAATNVVASLTLPGSTTFQSATGGGAVDANGTVHFASLGPIMPGGSVSLAVVAQVNVAGSLAAGAFASSMTPDGNLNNNHAQDVAAQAALTAGAPVYGFTKIVDTATALPDRPDQKFGIPGGTAPLAAIDGGKVAFVTNDPDNLSILWGANADGTGLTRLVDAATAMPGGEGDTFAAVQYVRLRGGTVVFLGFGHAQHDGVYSVPVAGGPVAEVVRSGSPRPENPAKMFGYQDFIQSFNFGSLGDSRVGVQLSSGEYAYPVMGNGTPTVLLYPGSSFQGASNRTSNIFGAPALSGTRAVFLGNSSLFATYLDEHRFVAVADTNTPSPSAPGGNFSYGNGDDFGNSQVEGDTVVFIGQTGTTNPLTRGIYSRTGNGAVVLIADTNTPAPDGTGNFASFSPAGGPETIALNAGEVVFAATDAANRAGLYSAPAAGGPITKIVATGDSLGGSLTLSGNPSFFQPVLQANGLGGHQVAFRGDFFDAAANQGGTGVFVASPGGLTTLPPPPPPLMPSVTLTVKGATETTESSGKALKLVFTRTGDLSAALKVKFKVTGSAVNGVDYAALKPKAIIPAGKSSVKVKIVPLDHGITGGGKKKLKIVLSPVDGYEVDTTTTVKLSIVDDE